MEKENGLVMKTYVPIYEWGSNFHLKNMIKNAPKEWFNNLPGGEADGKAPNEFDLDDIITGINIQMQHTNNPLIATEIAMDHEEQHDGYYNDDTGLLAMEAELESEEINQHVSDYMKDVDGKKGIHIIEFVIEEYGPDIVKDTKLIGCLKHLAEDLGHTIKDDIAFINTDIGPVHEKNA